MLAWALVGIETQRHFGVAAVFCEEFVEAL